MIDEERRLLEGRVLLLAPTARDAAATRGILAAAGMACFVCKDMDEVCREMGRGVGAALLPQESILADASAGLLRVLEAQPPWSDIPLLVLTPAGESSSKASRALEAMGHMTLIKRPVPISALVSTVRAALRDRGRQYANRDDAADRERQSEALRQSERELRFALDVGKLGRWQLDLPGRTLTCSETCKANYGRPPEAPFTYEDLFLAIHPDDRARVLESVGAALEGRADFEVEYRTVWPDATSHWVLVRGRGEYARDGSPRRMTGLTLDLSERKRMEDKLRQQADRLKEADRRKDEFLAMLAHELRNPLAAIANAAQLARRTGSDEHREWSHGVIAGQIKHLSRMIDDLLDVSRITRGRIQLRKQRLLLAPLVEYSINTVRPFLEERNHRLTVEIDPEPLPIDADPTRIEQVLVNLLNNAAKYTEAGGDIRLTIGREGEEAVIKVLDTGVGIPPDLLPRLFDLFIQGDRSIARSEGGLGIGLTLVKSLVEMHGGTVVAQSDGIGKGSLFVVRLPASKAPVEETSPPKPAAGRGAMQTSRVLVVDDNVDTARGLARLLKLLGHDVRTAHDGPTAIEAARDHQPDFVLLDIGLPGMDGYEVARNLRRDDGIKEATIIAISGYGQDSDRRRSREAGFDHHLVKPIDHDALLTLLARADAGA